MSGPFPYGSPAALRAALTDRLKKLADSSPFTVTELHRQFAYDRLVARVFSTPDAEGWVLKGAAALLARLDIARHSKDVDLSWQSTAGLDEAEQAFRAAVGRDVGDFFVFDVGSAAPLVGDKGRRFAVVAGLGGRPFAAFSVDLVAGQSMTATPDTVPPLVAVEIPGLLRVDYRAYPLVDHIADKVAACLETHVRGGGTVTVSSRYKDLVDLVLIARTQRPVAAELRRALLSETARRGVGLLVELVAPGPLWPSGYEAKAAEVPQLGKLRRFPAALAHVKTMVDPVLAGTAAGPLPVGEITDRGRLVHGACTGRPCAARRPRKVPIRSAPSAVSAAAATDLSQPFGVSHRSHETAPPADREVTTRDGRLLLDAVV